MKDFNKLQEFIKENGSVKASTAAELGYNSYDLRTYLEKNLIERQSRGIYILPVPQVIDTKPPKEPVSTPINSSHDKHKGFYCIINKQYNQAEEIFKSLDAQEPTNAYYSFALSYIYFLKGAYQSSYEYLLTCYKKDSDFGLVVSTYLILNVLKNYIDIPKDVISSFASKVDKTTLSPIFLNKIYYNIERGEYHKAEKSLFYIICKERENHQYRIGNQFLLATLLDIMKKQGYNTDFRREKNPSAIIAPPISSKQILTNTILQNALDSNDYAKAYELIEQYEIIDSKEIIIALLKRLELAKSKGYQGLNSKTKVVSVEETIAYTSTPEEESPAYLSPSVEEESVIRQTPSNKENLTPKISLEDQISTNLRAYKKAFQDANFTEAQKFLIRYDRLLRTNSLYRDLNYHYERLATAQKLYDENPALYLKTTEAYKEAFNLFLNHSYDSSLAILSQIEKYQEVKLLEASIYFQKDDIPSCEQVLNTISPSCQEPVYYRLMAYLKNKQGDYRSSLAYCIKYNNCHRHQLASIYILMANCYEHLHKPGKAIQVLRIAEAINQANGYTKDLSNRIEKNASLAEKNRIKRLIKQTGRNPENY